MTSYFATIPQNSNSFDWFNQSMSYYNQISSSQVQFNEVGSKYFTNFSNYAQNVNYVYMCQYASCDDAYKDKINIIYNSAVHMLTNFMSNNLKPNFNDSATDQQISLLFYSHYLLEDILYQFMDSYFLDYKVYEVSKYFITYILLSL